MNLTVRTSSFFSIRTYLLSALFVTGAVALPQLCHLFSLGGKIWLPIFFFVWIASLKYGLSCGLVTALLSPLINHIVTGMPAVEMLPLLTAKGVVLALIASLWVIQKGKIKPLRLVVGAIAAHGISFLIIGTIWTTYHAAWADTWLSLPGILVQIIGGYLLLFISSKNV